MTGVSAGRRWVWVSLGTAAYLLHLAVGKDSVIVEDIYSRGFFVGLRWVWDHSLGYSPVPVIDVLVAAAVLWGAWKISRLLSKKQPRSSTGRWKAVQRGGLLAASWAGGLVFFFYVLWGFHYNRISLERQLGLATPPLNPAALRTEAEWVAAKLSEARSAIPGATGAALDSKSMPRNLESGLRDLMSGVLKDLGYPSAGRVRVRMFRPGSLMLRFSGSGMYIPYCGEGYAAANLLAFEKPSVMAHEMAHGWGITDEGEAGFLGFLACQASAASLVRYSGLLSYWNYVAAELARDSPEEARKIAGRLPDGVKADMRAARENWDRFRGPLMNTGRAVYEKYLRSQGVKEGLLSYDRLVLLVAAWRKAGGMAARPAPRPGFPSPILPLSRR